MGYADPAKQREYQRLWRARRRAEWFAENGPCVDCGTWDQLQLDHADASTKVAHNVWSWAVDVRQLGATVGLSPRMFVHRFRLVFVTWPAPRHTLGQLDLAPVVEIRQRAAAGESLRSLARLYTCDHTAIGKVVRREAWLHVGE